MANLDILMYINYHIDVLTSFSIQMVIAFFSAIVGLERWPADRGT